MTGSRYELYVHLTDQTLATGTGVLRTETVGRGRITGDDLGPLLASQLAELLGPNPGTIVVKPVIDLRDQVSVDAYEIPDRIRERIRLRYLTCYFPWCNRPAIRSDLDHITPYTRARDGTGPPGQTGTENLAPGCRFHHRLKTHGGWTVQRLPDGAFVWTSPHGDMYLVDHTGTRLIHRATRSHDAAA